MPGRPMRSTCLGISTTSARAQVETEALPSAGTYALIVPDRRFRLATLQRFTVRRATTEESFSGTCERPTWLMVMQSWKLRFATYPARECAVALRGRSSCFEKCLQPRIQLKAPRIQPGNYCMAATKGA